jgi:hypothetical protein
MINTCLNCLAVREYPSGKAIFKCGSDRISYENSPTTQKERDSNLLHAIRGE